MSDVLLIAIIVASTGIVGPLILSILNGRQLERQKALDYARQDAVAKAADETARATQARADAAAEQAAEAARLLIEADLRRAAHESVIDGKLNVIHKLVNSGLTNAKQAEMDALVTTIAMMKEVIELKIVAGGQPSESAVSALRLTEAKARALASEISARLVADEHAAKQTEMNMALHTDHADGTSDHVQLTSDVQVGIPVPEGS